MAGETVRIGQPSGRRVSGPRPEVTAYGCRPRGGQIENQSELLISQWEAKRRVVSGYLGDTRRKLREMTRWELLPLCSN